MSAVILRAKRGGSEVCRLRLSAPRVCRMPRQLSMANRRHRAEARAPAPPVSYFVSNVKPSENESSDSVFVAKEPSGTPGARNGPVPLFSNAL